MSSHYGNNKELEEGSTVVPPASQKRNDNRRARLKDLTNLVHDLPEDADCAGKVKEECLAALIDEFCFKKSIERRREEMQKEEKRLKSELPRAIQAKTRVEIACKELRWKLRVDSEQTRLIALEEEKRMSELEMTCEPTLRSLQEKCEEHKKERLIQEEANEELKQRFEAFSQTSEERERMQKEQNEVREGELRLFKERLAKQCDLYADQKRRHDEQKNAARKTLY